MIELSAHIESLLLQHGCAIVPHFGAFVTQHVTARYVEDEHLFLPPARSVGFNEQLTTSDGLLANSYMRVLHVDFEQAEQAVDKDVEAMVRKLMEEGRFEMENVGTLVHHSNGTLEFFPCEAGVLSPEFYGLEAVNIKMLGMQQTLEPKLDLPQRTLAEAERRRQRHGHNDHVVIRLRRQWIYNAVGVAVAILLFFLASTPTGNPTKAIQEASLEQAFMSANSHADKARSYLSATPSAANSAALQAPAAKGNPVATEASTSARAKESPVKPTALAENTKPQAESQTVTAQNRFCIVLASAVSKRNAETFVRAMKEKGFDNVSIYEHGKMRRVVYSSFPDAAAATKKLNALHHIAEFSTAWVYEIK